MFSHLLFYLCSFSASVWFANTIFHHQTHSSYSTRSTSLRMFPKIFQNRMTVPYNTENIEFAILGGGAFSLALAKVLSHKNIKSTLLVRNQTVADYINTNHRHPKYLVDSELPIQLRATADRSDALKNANFVVHAVPMQQSREFLINMKPYLNPKVPILSVTKGVEIGTFSLMNDIISQTLGTGYRSAYLSGPSFALEIMNGQATAVVIASASEALASELALILSSAEFRCHTSRDVKVRVQRF